MARCSTTPESLAINPSKGNLAIYLHPDTGLFVPGKLADNLRTTNSYLDPTNQATFQRLHDSTLTSEDGMRLAFSNPDTSSQPRDLVIHFSPLNDGLPSSNPKDIHRYCSRTTDTDKETAQPNSWRPLANFHAKATLSKIEELNIAHMQIFFPEWLAMSLARRRQVALGDAHPYGQLAERALDLAEERYGHSFERVHFFGAGLSLKAIGAADYFQRSGIREVGSVTAMNFAVDPNPVRALFNYMLRSTTGKASDLLLPPNFQRVDELSIATVLDKLGAEKGMRKKQIQAFRKFMILSALVSARKAPDYLENLLENNVTVTVANALNESLVARSLQRIGQNATTHPRFHDVKIVGVEGTRTGMMTNEFFGLSAVVSTLGLKNYFEDQIK